MIIVTIILAVLLALVTIILAGLVGREYASKDAILQNNWEEFLAWLQDARKIKSLVPPYETWTETTKGTPHYVAYANEHNFWLWYLDYKWEKPNAATKAGSVS